MPNEKTTPPKRRPVDLLFGEEIDPQPTAQPRSKETLGSTSGYMVELPRPSNAVLSPLEVSTSEPLAELFSKEPASSQLPISTSAYYPAASGIPNEMIAAPPPVQESAPTSRFAESVSPLHPALVPSGSGSAPAPHVIYPPVTSLATDHAAVLRALWGWFGFTFALAAVVIIAPFILPLPGSISILARGTACGVLGSVIAAMWQLTRAVNKSGFESAHSPRYWVAPLIGAVIGGVFTIPSVIIPIVAWLSYLFGLIGGFAQGFVWARLNRT